MILMSRFVCLALALTALVAAPGCNSCFGSFGNCRRPSFMEFRSPCGRRGEPCQPPMAAPCGPVCEPCGPVCEPCCEGGMVAPMSGGGDIPVSAPLIGEPGTFS